MILVTGATGSNGVELIKRLSVIGTPIRAMVHRPRDSAMEAPPGVEFVTADFDDPASLRTALQGIERAFLVTNSTEKVEVQQLRFVELAHSAGVQHIVYLSQLHAGSNSPVRFLRYHGVVEEAIRESGIKFTHLRPNLYMQALLSFSRSIGAEGRFYAPVNDSRVSIVDVRDIAAVAAVALTEPGHQGKTYDITGPEALTHAAIALLLSEAFGRAITFVNIPEQTFRDALTGFGIPEWQADGLIEDYAHYRRGEASRVSSAVQDVTGIPPRSFRDFARDYHQAFSH